MLPEIRLLLRVSRKRIGAHQLDADLGHLAGDRGFHGKGRAWVIHVLTHVFLSVYASICTCMCVYTYAYVSIYTHISRHFRVQAICMSVSRYQTFLNPRNIDNMNSNLNMATMQLL